MANEGKGRTLLLTGGTGFVGRFLVPELLADGWQVVVLSRQSAQAVASILGSEVRAIGRFDEWGLEEGPAVCINLAGEGIMDRRWTPKRKEVLRKSRIGLTHDLVKWLNSFPSPPEVFLSGSAVGYYGIERGDKPLTEDEPAGRDFAAQLCHDWEQAARAINEKSRLCLIRTGIVLHGKHGALARMLPPFRMGLGGPIGEGRQVMPWIHIQDMVSGIIHLLHNEVSGAFNFASGTSNSNLAFARALGKALHRPAVMPMPAFALKALLGESAVLLLEGQHPVPGALEASGFRFAFPDIDGALQDLLG
ncbi:TIGR01777 family oxidoreductase [Sansalvadorimonas verongulae]|uniref:TIGR01777 family oxidoreductase n=1 Tax=Sansalvadorimonas verongulae TaxID=2172824 RepID=UPI0012BC018B|nr:TIGR01777 family oxidoreductase [Sansalvadorimonas verongulae]MTI12752.1 TIGR01777 family protein [Sansalvadorimonas verongulae]